jgi:SAM-dependent methyltransferase
LSSEFDNYVGIDTDAEAVAKGKERGIDLRLARTTGGFDYPDATFDGVILKDVLEHLLSPVEMVREVRRVLKPGGIAFASSPDAQRAVWHDYTHVRPYTKTSMKRLWEDQEFSIERVSYESVAPGSSRLAARSRSHRRALVYRAAAYVPFLPRNVWILARRP